MIRYGLKLQMRSGRLDPSDVVLQAPPPEADAKGQTGRGRTCCQEDSQKERKKTQKGRMIQLPPCVLASGRECMDSRFRGNDISGYFCVPASCPFVDFVVSRYDKRWAKPTLHG